MAELQPPMEFLELSNGNSVTFTVLAHEFGDVMIQPRRTGDSRIAVVPVLRLHVTRADKPVGVLWWDITAMGAIAQLMPLLEEAERKKRRITLTAHGWGAAKRFAIGFQ